MDGAHVNLGILANEFFDPALGRMGGFGWAVSRSVAVLREHPAAGCTPVVVSGDPCRGTAARAGEAHGARFLPRTRNPFASRARLREAGLDALLAIDYRPSYRWATRALADAPVVVWVRDPRTPDDVQWISTLEVPGSRSRPLGIDPVDCTSLADETARWRADGRPHLLAVTDACLCAKIHGTYGIADADVHVLPNPIAAVAGRVEKAARPVVVFLGRLDPCKRPWVFVELARRFPDVEFLLLGQSHFAGAGSWSPASLPANVRWPGHVDQGCVRDQLGAAWLLVNTSIHEGLAISFLEALACETPLVATVDTGGIVSRFGRFAGRVPGNGLSALEALEDALDSLLRDHERRRQLGREGRHWVEEHHSPGRFLAGLAGALAGVGAR